MGPPLLAVLLAGLLLAGLAVQNAAQPTRDSRSELAIANPDSEQCYAWDAFNATGLDANGLRVILTSVQTVTQVYTGAANPLGDASAASGYDAGNNRYNLIFGNPAVVIAAGESVHIGLCTPQVVSTVRFHWLAGQSTLSPAVTAPSLTWTWPSYDTGVVQLVNTADQSIAFLAMQMLVPESALDVDSLDASVVANIPSAGADLVDPLILVPAGVVSSTFALAVDLTAASRPVLFVAEWAEGDDLNASSTLYVQTSAPPLPHLYLPEVTKR